MFNKDLKNSEHRHLLLALIRGTVSLTGDVTLDDDDENGYFTITQTYNNTNGKQVTRTFSAQLTVNNFKETYSDEN